MSLRRQPGIWSRRRRGVVAAVAALVAVSSAAPAGAGSGEHPDRASTRREPVVETIHGTPVADPYRWLEQGDDPEVVAWAAEQDRLARSELARLPGRDAWRDRLAELSYVEAVSPPVRRGDRWFFVRTAAEAEKPVLLVRDGEGGPERVLVDPAALGDGESVALQGWWPSPDGRLLAYKLSVNNADESTMRVLDVESGAALAGEVIEGAKYASASWTPDGRGFYYTWLPTDPAIPADERPGRAEVRYHELAGDPAADPVVHPALHDPTTFLDAELSSDGRWLLLTVYHGWASSDLWFRDLTAAQTPTAGASPTERAGFRPLVVGRDALFGAQAFDGRLFVHTTEDAPRGRVFRVDPADVRREAWQEIVAQPTDATLEAVRVVAGHLVLRFLSRATSELEIRTLDGGVVRRVALPGLGTVGELAARPEDPELFVSYESFTELPTVLRLAVPSGEVSRWATRDAPVDTSRMVTTQVTYRSGDGTPVTMFLVHRRGLRHDGDNPVLLTGYGGFAVSMTPRFSSGLLAWVERGGVVAVPNLRGGGEYGEEWHRAGMLARKQNVFDDFVAAAEYLVDSGITRPERLGIRGGSNGGLLVGAAMTQRPELFGAVVCSVPLLDMVRYHLFGSGRTWVGEYGSAEDPAEFAALYAYSPYHRVAEGTDYPALLMMSADSDDRVDPMHARKFVAAVQWAAADPERPAWLRVEANAGHGGAGLRSQEIEAAADSYAFLARELRLAG